MSIKLQLPKITDLRPRLTVIGVGGAGCNAVNNMIAAGLSGVEFVVANTDAQALAASSAEHRIQLGVNLTEGLGAGAKPEIGEAAAEEAIEDLRAQITGSHMVFIAAGMGGGTGTGAAAVIARAAKELGILTVGVVTKPFQFEGARRLRIAEAGIVELRKMVDTLIVIPNQNLFRIASDKTTFAEAFVLADQVLYSGVACIVDLIVKEGLINLDFADVRTIMSGMGTAMMGTGEATGERRAITAAEEAISNPLLDDVSLKGAKGLLLSITGGHNLTLYEVDEAASRVRQEVDADANIIVGATFDEAMDERVRVSIVASGMSRLGEAAQPSEAWPRAMRKPAAPAAPAAALPPASNSAADHSKLARPSPAAPIEDADVQRRLAEALRGEPPAPARPAASVTTAHGTPYFAPTAPPEAAVPATDMPAPQSQPSAAPARDSWRALGNVTIEDGLPPVRTGPPRREAAAAPPAPQSFVPAPPAEMPRRDRRMPQVEDFPIVGQRDYHAKAQAGVHEHGYDTAEPQRRPGFFERITGRIRRQSESPERDGDHGVSEPPALPTNRAVPQQPAGGTQARHRGGSRMQEEAELPVFFTRERK
jgi:cell division protein FtsZ